MSHQARLSRNYLSLAAARFAAKVISFVAWVLIARHLGAADFGLFTFSFAVVTLAVVVFQAGLTPLTVREIARDRARAPRFLTTSLLVRFAGAAAVAAVAAGVCWAFPSREAAATTVTALALGLGTVLVSFTDVMQAFERMEYYAAVLVVNNVLILAFILYAVKTDAGLMSILWFYVAANGLAALTAAAICLVRFARPSRTVTWSEVVSFLKLAPDFSFSALVASIYWRADKVILKIFAGDAVVGIYGAAAGMVEGLVMVAGSFRESVFPALSRAWPRAPLEFREASRTSFKFLAALAVPICIGTSVVAPQLFPFIYRAEFARGSVILAVLIWALGAIFIRELTAATLFALDRQRMLLLSNAAGAAASVALNFALIPRWGGLGAAVAGVTTAFATTAFNLVLIGRRVPRLYPWGLLVRPAAAAVAMAAALLAGIYFHLPVLANIGGGAVVYGAALFATGYYTPAHVIQLVRRR
jgi:O-antigen/teichoic acid export membrane protein